ncbi:MAG TPA: dTMP kinase [Mycobacteriales bacterium]|nr:dTMP kinase [Mycobacteriales bacterium]
MRDLGEVATAPPQEREVRNVLAIQPFRRLWISLSLSSLGDWLGFLATTSLASELTHSYSHKLYAVAAVLFVRLLPALFIGPVAGAFADRFNRRTTMVVTDIIRFGLFLSIPLEQKIWWLLVASFLIECASLFWIPAKEASIPNLVPRNQLESANKFNLVTTYGFGAVAAVLFTALAFINRVLAHDLSFFRTNPVNLALYIDALTFLVSALTILNLHQISSVRPRGTDDGAEGEQIGFGRSILDGMSFIGGQRWLKGLVLGIAGATGAGAAVIGLSQRFAADLQGGDAAYGTLFGTVFVGLASGMFLGPRLIGTFSRRRVVGLGIIGCGITLAIEAVVPNLALAILTTGLMGFWAGLVWVVALTLVGSEVSDEIRGRTFAFLYNLMRLVLLVMVVAAPAIAGRIGPHMITVSHSRVRLDGVTITLFGAGLLAIGLGLVCYRLMDDRRDVPLWTDLVAAARRHRPQLGRGTLTGLFIVFEGGEGAGKSTQVRQLADAVTALGHEVVVSFEPGATPTGARLREILLDPETAGLPPVAEALLYAADRAQHVANVVRPALDRGDVVISDRYVDSSIAYQAGGRRLHEGDVRRLSVLATGGLRPDLTVLLDIPPEVGLTRLTGPGDRIEQETMEFHQRVRRTFLALASQSRGRYLIVDATTSAEKIHEVVMARTLHMLLANEIPPDVPDPQFSKVSQPVDVRR